MPARYPATASDMLEFLGRRVADQQLRCVLIFDERIDAERLGRAVRLTLDAQPVLGCRFRERPWRSFWERRDDLDLLELCALTETSDAEGEIRRFLVERGDPRCDPLVGVEIVRSRCDTVCVRLDHVAADAAALADYVRMLGAIYTRLGAEPSLRLEPAAGARGLDQVLRGFPVRRRWASLFHAPEPALPIGLASGGDGAGARVVLSRRLSAARLRGLRAFRLARNATTNHVLIAALFRALMDERGPDRRGRFSLQVSVDLRQLLPERGPAAICNLAGAVFPAISFAPDEPFDATLCSVSAAMRAIDADAPGLASAVLMQAASWTGTCLTRRLSAHLARGSIGSAPCIFSNLGVLGFRGEFAGATVRDAYMVGPVMYPPAFLLALSTFAGTATASAGTFAQGPARAEVERVLDRFVGNLPG